MGHKRSTSVLTVNVLEFVIPVLKDLNDPELSDKDKEVVKIIAESWGSAMYSDTSFIYIVKYGLQRLNIPATYDTLRNLCDGITSVYSTYMFATLGDTAVEYGVIAYKGCLLLLTKRTEVLYLKDMRLEIY